MTDKQTARCAAVGKRRQFYLYRCIEVTGQLLMKQTSEQQSNWLTDCLCFYTVAQQWTSSISYSSSSSSSITACSSSLDSPEVFRDGLCLVVVPSGRVGSRYDGRTCRQTKIPQLQQSITSKPLTHTQHTLSYSAFCLIKILLARISRLKPLKR